MTAPDLLDRLSRAEQGSRGLENEIARHLGWFRYTRANGNKSKHGGWIAPEDFLGTYSNGSPILDGTHGTPIWRDPPRWTSSMDDARKLVPDGMRW